MKILIIGSGNQGALADCQGSGNEHKTISFAHAFKERGAEIEFFDIDREKAIQAAKLWDATYQYDLNMDGFDIIILTTPDSTHYEWLIKISNSKAKLVICEKPLCETVAEAREIVELYKNAGIPILVNYTRRFIPELIDLKRRYDSEEFGEMETYQILYNRGDLHTGTHAIDFMNWFFEGRCNTDMILNGTDDNKMFSECDYRVWCIQLFFKKFYWQEQRIGDMPVPSYFDLSTRYVVDNAYNFLEGKEDLKCTCIDALRCLEIMEELK